MAAFNAFITLDRVGKEVSTVTAAS